ncbi:MAG: hypothetical protein M3306_17695 [Actinomycetota bacterium]|nr:hypothetical protein [Actinomycetota bacterium]
MTNTTDLLAGLVAAAEAAVKRAEASQKERRADAHTAGTAALSAAFGIAPDTPPAPTSAQTPSADEAQAERDAVRADLAALTSGASAPAQETTPSADADETPASDADLTSADGVAAPEAGKPATAPQSAAVSSSPETDAAMRALLADS